MDHCLKQCVHQIERLGGGRNLDLRRQINEHLHFRNGYFGGVLTQGGGSRISGGTMKPDQEFCSTNRKRLNQYKGMGDLLDRFLEITKEITHIECEKDPTFRMFRKLVSEMQQQKTHFQDIIVEIMEYMLSHLEPPICDQRNDMLSVENFRLQLAKLVEKFETFAKLYVQVELENKDAFHQVGHWTGPCLVALQPLLQNIQQQLTKQYGNDPHRKIDGHCLTYYYLILPTQLPARLKMTLERLLPVTEGDVHRLVEISIETCTMMSVSYDIVRKTFDTLEKLKKEYAVESTLESIRELGF